MSCGVGHRQGLDLVLLWLWCRLAATAPIPPLAWEPPDAVGAALKRQEKKKEKKSPEPPVRVCEANLDSKSKAGPPRNPFVHDC